MCSVIGRPVARRNLDLEEFASECLHWLPSRVCLRTYKVSYLAVLTVENHEVREQGRALSELRCK